MRFADELVGLHQCSFPGVDYFVMVTQDVNIGGYWVEDTRGLFRLVL